MPPEKKIQKTPPNPKKLNPLKMFLPFGCHATTKLLLQEPMILTLSLYTVDDHHDDGHNHPS